MTIDERISKSIEMKLLPIKVNFGEKEMSGTRAFMAIGSLLTKKFKETKGEYFPEIDVPFTRESMTDESIRFAYLSAYGTYLDPWG